MSDLAVDKGRGRIAYIDGLRAVAVLMVVIYHTVEHSPAIARSAQIVGGWRRLGAEGAHGVELFFVLSGFCLSYPVLQRLYRNSSTSFEVAGFFARRIIRIVPPYYSAILLLSIFAFVLSVAHQALPPGMDYARLPDVLKQIAFMDRDTKFLSTSFWTLCIEFRWYLLFPIALLIWIKSKKLFVALTIAAPATFLLTRLNSLDLGMLAPLLLGIVAADLQLRPRPVCRAALLFTGVFVLVGLWLEYVPGLLAAGDSVFYPQTNIGWQLAMFCAVVAGGQNALTRRVLSLPALTFIGAASYSIYLVHEPIVGWLDTHIHSTLAAQCAGALIAALLGGVAFWLLFERPWTQGSLKSLALQRLEPFFGRFFAWAGVPRLITFGLNTEPRHATVVESFDVSNPQPCHAATLP